MATRCSQCHQAFFSSSLRFSCFPATRTGSIPASRQNRRQPSPHSTNGLNDIVSSPSTTPSSQGRAAMSSASSDCQHRSGHSREKQNPGGIVYRLGAGEEYFPGGVSRSGGRIGLDRKIVIPTKSDLRLHLAAAENGTFCCRRHLFTGMGESGADRPSVRRHPEDKGGWLRPAWPRRRCQERSMSRYRAMCSRRRGVQTHPQMRIGHQPFQMRTSAIGAFSASRVMASARCGRPDCDLQLPDPPTRRAMLPSPELRQSARECKDAR